VLITKYLSVFLLTGVVIFLVYASISTYIMVQTAKTEVNLPDHLLALEFSDYSEVNFYTDDENNVLLKGWWIPGNHGTDQAVLFIHGINGNRASDFNVIKEVHNKGYSILTFDLRGHGFSDKSDLGLTVNEKHDIKAAIQFLKKIGTTEIVIFGYSYGGTIGISHAHNFPVVKGVIADSPFNDLSSLMSGEVSLRTGLPNSLSDLLKPGIIASTKLFKGIDIREIKPQNAVMKLNYPILLIHCKDDTRIPINHSDDIYEYAPTGSIYQRLEKCEHADGYNSDFSGYMSPVFRYLETIFSR
tara:strand:+ start:557 stop:1456 length:900 start_codon:yes stop_codon:yes gene_type:complete